MRQMIVGDGHNHQQTSHGWNYAQDRDKFSGFAAVPTEVMVGAYAAQNGPVRDSLGAPAEVDVEPDWSCSPDRVARFSRGLDCRVMPGTAVTVEPPPPGEAAYTVAGGGSGRAGHESRWDGGDWSRRSTASRPATWTLRWVSYFFYLKEYCSAKYSLSLK
jgi:hypothetical protein